MNIIKLKDIILPDDCRFSKFFNKSLKGKYAYWVKMRYIFPLESLDYKTYIQYEQMDDVQFISTCTLPHIDLYSEECCMYDFAQVYIDQDATELANAIHDYKTANEYVADYDIDINKLRRFRSWLAGEILAFNTRIDGMYLDNLTDNQIHMLEYYKNDMYNEVVKQLNIFGTDNAFTLLSNTSSGCNCCNNTQYVLATSNTCNGLDIYTKNIHSLMVQTFEDINFWMQFNTDFIGVFKKYIDNIIKTGLSVIKPSSNILYSQCNCTGTNSTSNIVLKNLSESLQYIMNNEIQGHSNFIHDSLHNWADQLYDYMSWEIK